MSTESPPVKLTKQQIKQTLWERGVLRWKMDQAQYQGRTVRHDVQVELYEKFTKANPNSILVWHVSRQQGKTWALALLAIEQCQKKAGSIVKFITDTKVHAETILAVKIEEICADCPAYLRPEYNKQKYVYTFPNGSQIQLAGSDGKHYEKLRGQVTDLLLVDEAGFCHDLKQMVIGVLLPTTIHTGGKIVLASTSPVDPNHEFLDFIEQAEMSGNLTVKTIEDSPLLSPEQVEHLIESMGGRASEQVRRELFCEIIRSEESTVIPEFTEDLIAKIVKEWPKPKFYDPYVSMDLGYDDLTVVLFGYYDFLAGVLVIEDEIVKEGKSLRLDMFSAEIIAKEEELWTNTATNELIKPYMRVSDINKIVTSEIYRQSGGKIFFKNADKYDNETSINNLRVNLANKKIIIHPRCKTLILHLKNARWKKTLSNGTRVMARGTDGSHYDACFVAGTKVLTSTGYKEIQDIQVGESVLTHNDRFRPVLNIMSRDYSGELCEVSVEGRLPVTCTPEHNFYTAQGYRNRKNGYTGQRFYREPEWTEAQRLEKLNVKIPLVPVGEVVNISKEMCFLYEYWVAEGSLSGNKHGVGFAGHKKETKVADTLLKAVNDHYGTGAGTSQTSLRRHRRGTPSPRNRKVCVYQKEGNGRNLVISSKGLWEDLRPLGKSTWKQFPEWSVSLSKEQALFMLTGYIFGDGHFGKGGVVSGSISESIARTVDVLYRKCGITPMLGIAKRKGRWKSAGGKMISNDMYTNKLNKPQSLRFLEMIGQYPELVYILEDKNIHDVALVNRERQMENFKRVASVVVKPDQVVTVYNLEVEEDNSYTANDLAVHNCDAAKYLNRHIAWGRNPYPHGHSLGLQQGNFHVANPEGFRSGGSEVSKVLTKMFGKNLTTKK